MRKEMRKGMRNEEGDEEGSGEGIKKRRDGCERELDRYIPHS